METVNVNEIIAAMLAIIAAGGGVVGAAKFKNMRKILTTLLAESPAGLKEAVDSLSAVVAVQGDSIEWLRNELAAKNDELEKMRIQLEATKSLVEENVVLRERVTELEAEVAALRTELDRRRKYTPKKLREEDTA